MVSLAALKGRVLEMHLRWKQRTPYMPLKIPTSDESSSEFTSRAQLLLSKSTTRVYVDTSFLMWMTKIGSTSRTQFVTWLAATCPGRVCVPVWSAHEYLRHHTSGTILDELSERLSEMSDVAGKSYTYLRPFLDTQLDPGTSLDSQQVIARNALNELQKLSQMSKAWRSHYRLHANDVIEFINAHVSNRTDVFSLMDGIQSLGGDRFDGRVPPGFQDRGKKNRVERNESSLDGGDCQIGSNRWGDLIFWKEVLTLSAMHRARDVILLTNDQKNDWQLGGRQTPDEQELHGLKSKWRPLPFAHPMLSLEASIEAKVQQVMMLDSIYLGLMLKRHGGNDVQAFVDVSLVPDPPAPLTARQQRKERIKSVQRETDETSENIDAIKIDVPQFQDNPELQDGQFALAKAWLNSKNPVDTTSPVYYLLQQVQQAMVASQSVADLMTKDHLGNLTTGMLVYLGRELHDNCITGDLGNPEAITDIVGALKTLPPRTASNLFLGILGSMYFDRKNNEPRRPPSSPALDLIFDQQSLPFAAVPTKVIKNAFRNRDTLPLYLPSADVPDLDIALDHEPDADGEVILGSIMFAGIELFSVAQTQDSLNLRKLFGGREMLSAQEILEATCKCFAIPLKQVCYKDNLSSQFQITLTAGFRPPKQVHLENLR